LVPVQPDPRPTVRCDPKNPRTTGQIGCYKSKRVIRKFNLDGFHLMLCGWNQRAALHAMAILDHWFWKRASA